MPNSNRISRRILLAIVTIFAVLLPAVTQAATIVKSKSNVANNRTLPVQSGPGTVVLFCESCTFAGLPEEGHIILMDSLSGDIWAYSDKAIAGEEDPIYVGTMSVLGKRITKKVRSSEP